MLTREQIYAKKAYEQVETVSSHNCRADYKSAAKSLAVLIRTAGLVQAVHFSSTRNDGSKQLIEDLEANIGCAGLLDEARNVEIGSYIRLTDKCLAALKWYKRFVDIHIPDEEEN